LGPTSSPRFSARDLHHHGCCPRLQLWPRRSPQRRTLRRLPGVNASAASACFLDRYLGLAFHRRLSLSLPLRRPVQASAGGGGGCRPGPFAIAIASPWPATVARRERRCRCRTAREPPPWFGTARPPPATTAADAPNDPAARTDHHAGGAAVRLSREIGFTRARIRASLPPKRPNSHSLGSAMTEYSISSSCTPSGPAPHQGHPPMVRPVVSTHSMSAPPFPASLLALRASICPGRLRSRRFSGRGGRPLPLPAPVGLPSELFPLPGAAVGSTSGRGIPGLLRTTRFDLDHLVGRDADFSAASCRGGAILRRMTPAGRPHRLLTKKYRARPAGNSRQILRRTPA